MESPRRARKPFPAAGSAGFAGSGVGDGCTLRWDLFKPAQRACRLGQMRKKTKEDKVDEEESEGEIGRAYKDREGTEPGRYITRLWPAQVCH